VILSYIKTLDELTTILHEANIAYFCETHALGPDEPNVILDQKGETVEADLYQVVHFSEVKWEEL
jgi:hypothetical protein